MEILVVGGGTSGGSGDTPATQEYTFDFSNAFLSTAYALSVSVDGISIYSGNASSAPTSLQIASGSQVTFSQSTVDLTAYTYDITISGDSSGTSLCSASSVSLKYSLSFIMPSENITLSKKENSTLVVDPTNPVEPTDVPTF